MVLHVVPAVRQDLPGGVRIRSKGSAGPAQARRRGEARMNPAKMVRDLFHGPPTPGVLGVFGHLDATVDAVKQLQAGGRDHYTRYSPLPPPQPAHPTRPAPPPAPPPTPL